MGVSMACIGWLYLLITLVAGIMNFLGPQKTRKVLGSTIVAFMVGFILGVVMFPAIYFVIFNFDVFVPPDFLLFVPLVFGSVVSGLVEGIRQRKSGGISIMPIVWAVIVGGVGSFVVFFLSWGL